MLIRDLHVADSSESVLGNDYILEGGVVEVGEGSSLSVLDSCRELEGIGAPQLEGMQAPYRLGCLEMASLGAADSCAIQVQSVGGGCGCECGLYLNYWTRHFSELVDRFPHLQRSAWRIPADERGLYLDMTMMGEDYRFEEYGLFSGGSHEDLSDPDETLSDCDASVTKSSDMAR